MNVGRVALINRRAVGFSSSQLRLRDASDRTGPAAAFDKQMETGKISNALRCFSDESIKNDCHRET